MAYHLPGGSFYGRDPEEARERSLAAQALRGLAGYEQERPGVVRTDSRQGDKFRSHLSHKPISSCMSNPAISSEGASITTG